MAFACSYKHVRDVCRHFILYFKYFIKFYLYSYDANRNMKLRASVKKKKEIEKKIMVEKILEVDLEVPII